VAERPLHVAVDGRELAGRPTGVGRYLLEVLRQWRAHPVHRFTVVVPAAPPEPLGTLGPALTWMVEPARSAGTWWEQTRLPRILADLRPDVLFASGYTAPIWSPVPFVLAVYDVSFCAHPEWFSWREGLRRRWVTRAAARRASAVVTSSEFSKSEIRHYLGVPADRIVLAPPGAPPEASPSQAAPPPVVLYVGSLFNRRHLPEMIEAFAQVRARRPDVRFVLVGDNRTNPRLDPLEIARRAGLAGAVEWRAYVDDRELDRLYRSAGAFLFLSDYEGFAMTPLEALARGVPGVLQDTPVSREVYGEGAMLVPPEPRAVAEAIDRLLSDPAARETTLAAGRARLAGFTWERSAGRILRALEQASA
jgi:glycosyltransferase involved in cell wall biosynthesis